MNESGLKAVFLEERPMLMRLLVARLRSREEAEDALQDMWLKLDQLVSKPVAQPAAPSWQFKPREKISPDMWRAFAKSLNAEPRSDLNIVGSSGITHRLEAIAVDDKDRRIIAVTSEPDPIKAALIRSDIQTTMTDVRVLLARPITVDVGVIARREAKS